MAEWQIKRETVYRLYRDGEVICDTDGRPAQYESEEHAQHVALNWDRYRAPTLEELRALPDAELDRRIGQLRRPWWRQWT